MALFVTSQFDHTVREYDATTGAFVKVATSGGGLGDPIGVGIGADGNLLVSDGQTNSVKRYNRATGAFIDVFASTNVVRPLGISVHGGTLYVTNSNPPEGVQSFDAVTGANTGHFVPSRPNPVPNDVKVNPANNRLYVLYYNDATVETFDLTTKASFGLLMPVGNPTGSGGLFTPIAMAFGPDGNLYISGGTLGGQLGVRRYNPATGAFIDFFANTGNDIPLGLAFGPDNNLYVATAPSGGAAVMRFNYQTGASMGYFVPPGSGGLTAPYHLTFDAEEPVVQVQSFAGQNWLITPAATAADESPPRRIQDQKWLLVLSGVAIVNVAGNNPSDWLRETVLISPDLSGPLHYAINKYAIPTPFGIEGLNYFTQFQVEQWAPFAGLSSIFNGGQSIHNGFAVDVWRPNPFLTGTDAFTNAPLGNLFSGVQVDIAVRDTGAMIYRLSYNFTLLGTIVFGKGRFLTVPTKRPLNEKRSAKRRSKR
jgi:sugar lactone lactonase YvrE